MISHTSSTTSLKPHRIEIEGDHEEHAVDFISDYKIGNWPRGKGTYLQFLTHVVSFDIAEWMLLEQVDECERLSIFLSNEKWEKISMGKDCLDFVVNYPMRNVVVHKDFFVLKYFLFFSRGGFCFWDRSSVTSTYEYRTYRTPYIHTFHECTGDY